MCTVIGNSGQVLIGKTCEHKWTYLQANSSNEAERLASKSLTGGWIVERVRHVTDSKSWFHGMYQVDLILKKDP